MNKALNEIRSPNWNIAVLTLYGKASKADTKDAVALDKRLTGTSKTSKDRIRLVAVNVPSRGTDLLRTSGYRHRGGDHQVLPAPPV